MKHNKLDVQKNTIKCVLNYLICTNIAILEFQLTLTDNKEEIKGLKNLIKKSREAQKIVWKIDHYEILISLYNMYINKKETYFISLVGSITSKEMRRWDKTKVGFKEFLKAEKEAQDDYNKTLEEGHKNLDFIRKAKENGKKVEMIYKDGKIKPVIVEEKSKVYN